MALTYGEISSITQKLYIPKLVDNIFASNALLNRWRKKAYRLEGGGTSIMQPLLYATTTASGWYTGSASLSTTSNDQITAAEFNWRQIYGNITITRTDELKNSGKEQVINFVKAKVQACEKTVADSLGTGLFNAGTTTDAIEGLRLACAGTGSTYGGISKTTYSWWRGQTDATSTAFTLPVFQALFGDCTVDNDRPTVAVTTQDIYDDVYGTLQPQQRFTDKTTANGGFTNILLNGIPIIVDSHCPQYYMFLLNENYLEIVAHRDENFRFEPFIKPVNQNVSTAKVYWAGNLTCSNARMQGMFSALA